MEKPKELKKLSASLTKVFDCVDHNKLWKILTEMGILDHLTCLLRNLYAGQEATVRTGMEQQTSSKLGKEYVKAILSPCYLNITQNTRLEKEQDGITLMTESKEEPKSLFMKQKEESEKAGLKLNIQKN